MLISRVLAYWGKNIQNQPTNLQKIIRFLEYTSLFVKIQFLISLRKKSKIVDLFLSKVTIYFKKKWFAEVYCKF